MSVFSCQAKTQIAAQLCWKALEKHSITEQQSLDLNVILVFVLFHGQKYPQHITGTVTRDCFVIPATRLPTGLVRNCFNHALVKDTRPQCSARDR